jgi:rhamnosyltransferase
MRPGRDEVGAVVVTFNPDSAVSERLDRIHALVGTVVIVDNASAPDARRRLVGWADQSSATLIANPLNRGIAAALNQGITAVKAAGKRWALLFDQDTVAPPDLLERLAAAWEDASRTVRVGLAGPEHADPRSGAEGGFAAPPWIDVPVIITSGTLVPLSVHEALGPFREEYFIDFVDVEYCLRARSAGFRVLKVPSARISHSIGAVTTHRLGWRFTGTSNHSPERRYYMLRNHVALVRQYWRREPWWTCRSVLDRAKSLTLMALFERQRGAKLRRSWQGLVDGVTGRFDRSVS